MHRPKNGYFNAAGEPILGTTTRSFGTWIKTAVKIWAYKRGQQGLPLYGRVVIDIGWVRG
jgi:hypothetical protein